MSPSKQEIIDAIKRTTQENGGKPLGMNRFQNETGISPYDWGKFWARFGDAQKEAGLTPNSMTAALEDDIVFVSLAELIRKLKRFPTRRELRVERTNNPGFPSEGVFARRGTQQEVVRKAISYYETRDGYVDVVEYCKTFLSESDQSKESPENLSYGYVYLFKSGRDYKIGKSIDVNRRGGEVGAQLPSPLEEIHRIKTDDPFGVEKYWHERFSKKRKRGEWYSLSTSDVKAFRRWRNIG